MKQGVLTNGRARLLLSEGHTCFRPRRTGQRRRKSVRGCIVDGNLSVLNLTIVKKGPSSADIPGLTDRVLPRRLGPKRVGKIRKLFNLSKDDDVRQYVVRRTVTSPKPRTKQPKIQRLVTPVKLQRRRSRLAEKREAGEKAQREAREYAKIISIRAKEAKEKRREAHKRRRLSSTLKSTASQ